METSLDPNAGYFPSDPRTKSTYNALEVDDRIDRKDGNPYEEGTISSYDPRETMSSPGLESVRHLDTEKEAYPSAPQEINNVPPSERSLAKRRFCGLPLWVIIALGLVLVALAVGLGAGLGVGLNSNNSSSKNKSSSNAHPTSGTQPSMNPNYYSTTGAFNGTGVALATESFGQESYGTVVVYFQHWTGQIRSLQLASDGTWYGGGETNIVATDARNGTPIAAVAYAMESVSTWHIFYIDKNDTLQEVINGNTTNQWQVGPLGGFGFKAMDDPNVALQGCWEGYRPGGQINAIPIAGTSKKYNSSSQTLGINLWYGADPTTLQSVSWTFGTTTWKQKEALDGVNAHAGVGCYSWGPGTVTYLMASDLHSNVNIWWKDLNTSATGNSSHPIGQWTNSSISIPNTFQNTSLGYTDFLYAQDSALNLVGYNVSWAAEKTSFVPGDNFVITSDLGLAGTRMTVTAVPNDSGGQTLLVFNQVNGDTITEYTRDLVQGQWTSLLLPIPHQ